MKTLIIALLLIVSATSVKSQCLVADTAIYAKTRTDKNYFFVTYQIITSAGIQNKELGIETITGYPTISKVKRLIAEDICGSLKFVTITDVTRVSKSDYDSLITYVKNRKTYALQTSKICN